jgi:cob(I)alamin adenosyltransferase
MFLATVIFKKKGLSGILRDMAKIEFQQVTTRGGDRGESSLADGERRRKDDMFFHTLGTIDELNAQLGFVKASVRSEGDDVHRRFLQTAGDITRIQESLQKIAAQVAIPRRSALFEKSPKITDDDIEEIEIREQSLMERTDLPRVFVNPGDSPVSASIHVERTVCRRSERWIVSCIRERGLDYLIPAQKYLNRLADYLFVCALWYDQNMK